MSCHDGTVAIDSSGTMMPQSDVISTTLKISHPIGFSYDDAYTARGSGELVNKNTPFATAISISYTAGVYNPITRQGPRNIVDGLYNSSILTCATCHDVHNCNTAQPDLGHTYNYFLNAKEENSLICLSCHLK